MTQKPNHIQASAQDTSTLMNPMSEIDQESQLKNTIVTTKTPTNKKLKYDHSPDSNKYKTNARTKEGEGNDMHTLQLNVPAANKKQVSRHDPQTEYRSYAEMHNTDRGTSVPQTGFAQSGVSAQESEEVAIDSTTQQQLQNVNVNLNSTNSTYTDIKGITLSKYIDENSTQLQENNIEIQGNSEQSERNNMRDSYPLLRKGKQVYAQGLVGPQDHVPSTQQKAYNPPDSQQVSHVTPAFAPEQRMHNSYNVAYNSQGTKFDYSANASQESSVVKKHQTQNTSEEMHQSQTSSQFNDYIQKMKVMDSHNQVIDQAYPRADHQKRRMPRLIKNAQRYASVGHTATADTSLVGSFYSSGDFQPTEDVFESKVGLNIRRSHSKYVEKGGVDTRLSNALRRENDEMTVSKAGKFLRHGTYGTEQMIANSMKHEFEQKIGYVRKNKAQVKNGPLMRNSRQAHMLKKLEIERHYIGALLSAQKSQAPTPQEEYSSVNMSQEMPRNSLPTNQSDFQAGNDLRRLGPKNSLGTQMYLCHFSVNKEAQRNASQSSLIPVDPDMSIPSILENARMVQNRSVLDNSMMQGKRKKYALDNYHSQGSINESMSKLGLNTSINRGSQASLINKGSSTIKSIMDYEDHELDERGLIDKETYIDFKRRAIEKQNEGKYESESDHSISENDEFETQEKQEQKQFRKYGGLDYQADKDRIQFKSTVEMMKAGDIDLKQIMMKSSRLRSSDEIDHMASFLKFQVPYFKKFDKQLLIQLCDKLEGKNFKKHEYLMREGTVGDCMFIIFDGECGVYRNEANGKRAKYATTILKRGAVCGEQSLKTTDTYEKEENTRNASIISHIDKTRCLELNKQDYHEIVHQYKVVDLLERQKYLKNKIPFFKEFPKVKLVDFNQALDVQDLKQGQVIYDVGSPAEAFYILKQGKCLVETIIEIESFYRFPIDKRKWELRKVTRKVQYKIHEVSKGGFFGHEEILQGYRRRSRVKALTGAQVYYINAEQMLKHMPIERQDYLKSTMRSFDLETMVQKINRQFEQKKYMNRALLDGTKMNGVNFSGARLGYNGEQVPIRKMKKLSDWIDKARQNKTKDKNLIHELKKIVVLSKTEEPIEINQSDADVDIVQSRRARFVLPHETKQQLQFQSSIISSAQHTGFTSPGLSPTNANDSPLMRTEGENFQTQPSKFEIKITADLDATH